MICLLYFVAGILWEHLTPMIVVVEICKLFANTEYLTSAFHVRIMSLIVDSCAFSHPSCPPFNNLAWIVTASGWDAFISRFHPEINILF